MKKPPLEKPQLPTSKNQASEEKFRRLFEAAQDGILLLDAGTGEITDANPIIEAMLGYFRTELIGKKLWEIDAFKDLTANQAAFTLLQKKRYFRNDDLAIRTKDGQLRNIEFVSNVYQAGRQKTIQCNFRDITESRLAVTSLVESEERYRDLFDNASLGIFKTSANGRIISVNPAFARMFGYGSPEEFKSLVRNAADVFVDPQRRAEIIRLQAEHPELTGFENLYRRKDGSTFIGSLTVRQVTGRDGREALFEGFIEDISERIRAERALRESELKSRIIFENSTAGVALVGLDAKYLMVNSAFCEIHGYSAEELLKMNFFQLTHPDDIELSRKTAQEVVRGGSKSTRFFKRYIHKDGHTIWAEVSSALVYGIDGQPEYFITHVSDITERKRMEEALQKSEAELRALIEEIPAIVYTESADEPGKTLYISPQIETITGYTPAEWMRSANFWYEIVHPEDLEYLQAEDERTNRTGAPFHAEYRILKRDGSVLWILDEAILIRDDSGKALFWQGVMHDISDKKQAEKALQESEARYQLISTVASDYMFSTQLDADGSLTLTWVAGAFEAITGYTKEEYIAHGGWRSTLHPDDLAVDDRDLEKLRAGQSVITEIRTFTKSGKMVWVRVYAQPVLNAENKELVSIYGAVQDITERKQAEEALKLNMEELVALNQASQAVATSLDLNQVLTKIVELAGKVGGPDYISIVLVDENGRISSSIENIPDTLSLQQRVRKRGLTNWIIQTRQPVIVDEVGEDGIIRPRIGKGAPRSVNPNLVAKGIKSFIGLPLMVENHVEGVAYLHSLRRATFHDKLTLLTTFANQAAIAIGKARLYDAVQKELADRIKAEQAQQHSELMFRALFELSPDAVVLIDPQDPNVEWPIIDCNAAACRMNGYRRDELIGHSIDILNENSETPDGRAIYFKALGEDGPRKLETNHIHKSGRAFPVEISTSLIKVGERELVIGIDRDITERKRAEASLQFSLKQAEHNRGMLFALNKAGQAVQRARSPEEVYISIQKQMKHLGFTATVLELKDAKEGLRIAYLDYDSRLVRMAEKLTGLSKNDFRFHPRQGSIFQRVLEQGETVHIADAAQAVAEVLPEKLNALTRPTKEMLHLEQATFAPLTVEGKAIGVLVVTGGDLSEEDNAAVTAFANQAAIAIENARLYEKVQKELAERERAEQSLAKERNLLRSLIDTVPDFIYVKDSESRFVLVNMASARGAGYSRPEESLGKTDFDYFPEELAARYFADDQKVLQSGEPLLQHEEPSVDAKGNQLWLSTSKVPLRDAQGKIYGLVGTGRDITAHKKVEAELEASREAERNFSERLTILSEVTTELSKAENLDTLCRRAVELGRERLDFDRLSIFFLSEDSGAILGTFGVDTKGQITDERGDQYPVNPESNMWSILHSRTPQLLLTETPLSLRGQNVGHGMHVFAGLWDGNKVIGSITIDNLLRQRPFSDRDCEIIRLYASAVGHLISLKRTQEGLHASEERFAKSFQANPLPTCISEFPDGRMVEVNDAFLRLTGYTRADAIYHSGPELDLWVDPEMRTTIARELLDNGHVRDIEGRLRTKTGQLRDILASAEIIQLSEQPHALIMLSDITERKQTQVLQEAVYRIAAATETTSSLDELYPQIHQIISSVMPAENFYIALYDEAQDLLRFSYFRDTADEPYMGGIQPGKGLTAYVLRTGSSLLCTQAVHDELERRGEVKLLGVPSAIWLGVPLIVEGKTIGAMVVQHYTDPEAYGEREQHVLEFVSTQVAIAINRKRAETELQVSREAEKNFAERLTILSEVTTELSKAENLDTLCRRSVELGRERLDFDRLAIWFLSEDHTSMLGTFGVDTEGRYTDERGQQFPIDPDYPIWPVLQGQTALLRLADTALSLNGQVVGRGMHVSAGLWDGKTVIGYLSLDNLLHQRPFSDQDSDIIRLFASALGHLVSLKRVQEGLRVSEERYRMLFELSPDSIAVHQEGKVIITNPSTLKLLGASSPEQVIGKPVLDLVHPDYRQIVLERTRQQITEGKSVPVLEEKFLRLDGSAIDVDVTAAPITYADKPASMVIFRDISERKHAAEVLKRQSEELNRRNEELARLYRASGSLLSGASSSLQELAQTILGVVQKEFGQANCSLLVVQRDLNELQRLATAGPYAEQVKEKTLTLDGLGLVPQAIRTGEAVNSGNIRSNSENLSNWEAARSEMAIPLKIGSEVIGVIDVQSSEPNAFSQDDERLMTVFAERAALALEHNRLYEQAAIRVQQLAALRTVDMAISSSFDINLTLGILLDQLSAQLGIHAADILVYEPVTQIFRFSCGRGFRTSSLEHTQLRLGEGLAGRVALDRQLLKVLDLRAEPSRFGKALLPLGENFVGYMGVPLIAKGQIKGVLEVFQREPLELSLDQQAFLEMLAGQAGIAIDNAGLFEHQQRAFADLNNAYDETLEGWASALELRDKETEGHTRRVTDQTIRLAQAVGVKKDDLIHIYRGALLHDIGKIGIPDSIVLKPGPLTKEERETMHMHPNYAYKMLSSISYLREALNIPYCHHEKWNGTGYPRGLKGAEIPLAARIFSVVDVWDALISDRPYRKAWQIEKAREYIQEQAGLHFDPEVVEAFLNSSFAR